MRIRTTLLILCLAISSWTSVGLAHDEQMLDQLPAPHGGQIRMAGRYHVELVLEPSRLRAFFTSHAGKEVTVPAGPVSAKILSGGEERFLALEVLGESVLGVDGAFPFREGMAVELTIERGEKSPLVVRFTPRGYASGRDAPARRSLPDRR
ncbi:MAG: hypothetical protein ACREQJ_15575 [Candidatus Binatia bacterium]